MSRKDRLIRILIVVGVLYTALLVVMIIFFAMSIRVLSGLRITYDNTYPTSTPQEEVEDSDDSNNGKERRTLVLEGAKFGGEDLVFSAEFSNDVQISDDSDLQGGGGYIGLKALGEDLDIRFGLPYEYTNLKYINKVKISSSNELNDIFRVKTNDGLIFYSNRFVIHVVSYSYCHDDTGDSEDCATPVLFSNHLDQFSDSFGIYCNLETDEGLKNCDDVVKSLRFE